MRVSHRLERHPLLRAIVLPDNGPDVEHYCVHFYDDDIDVLAVYDDDHLGTHRHLDHDEYRAFLHDVVKHAIENDPALVLDLVADDRDFCRVLDLRRTHNRLPEDPPPD